MTGDGAPPGCQRGWAPDGKCCPHVATDLQRSRRGTSEKFGVSTPGSAPTAAVTRCRLKSSKQKHPPQVRLGDVSARHHHRVRVSCAGCSRGFGERGRASPRTMLRPHETTSFLPQHILLGTCHSTRHSIRHSSMARCDGHV